MRLLRVELLRLRSRRLVRAAVVVLLLLIVAIHIGQFVQARSKPADVTGFRQERLARYDKERANFDEFVSRGGGTAQGGPDLHNPTREEFGNGVEFFGDPVQPPDKRYHLREEGPDAARAVGGFLAVVFFILGASAGGAEWGAGTMQALLSWEPRRLRVLAAKALALIAAACALALLIEVVTLGLGVLVASLRGTLTGLNASFWRDLAGATLRSAGIASFTAVVAFSVAGLIRNTAGALGAGFVYFAVLEQAIVGLKPRWAPYLMTPNIATWINGDPFSINGRTLTPGRAGITLLLYAALLIAACATWFTSRDVT
jgi:ABC-type transport system involved in multi-copper enzyme maturation permease subunit